MGTKAITDASFQADVLDSATPVLVDFWAEWCGPCKMIGPSLEEIADELGDKVVIAKINIDENPAAPGKYGVRGGAASLPDSPPLGGTGRFGSLGRSRNSSTTCARCSMATACWSVNVPL